jgi:hypothetical protein
MQVQEKESHIEEIIMDEKQMAMLSRNDDDINGSLVATIEVK